MSDFSTIIISSPARSHPSSTLVDEVIASVEQFVEGAVSSPIILVCDGYRESRQSGQSQTKRGKVDTDLACKYHEYMTTVEAKYRNRQAGFTLLRLDTHYGFAFAVKAGLELATTEYCMILQHDRAFCPTSSPLTLKPIIDTMMTHSQIRYVGFPTSTNVTHDRLLKSKYKLDLRETCSIPLPAPSSSYFLCPLVFWFDSNHFAHRRRYLGNKYNVGFSSVFSNKVSF
jgi:hypothetical protein